MNGCDNSLRSLKRDGVATIDPHLFSARIETGNVHALRIGVARECGPDRHRFLGGKNNNGLASHRRQGQHSTSCRRQGRKLLLCCCCCQSVESDVCPYRPIFAPPRRHPIVGDVSSQPKRALKPRPDNVWHKAACRGRQGSARPEHKAALCQLGVASGAVPRRCGRHLSA